MSENKKTNMPNLPLTLIQSFLSYDISIILILTVEFLYITFAYFKIFQLLYPVIIH